MVEFLLAVLLLELTPGPNMAYLATLAIARGRTAGLIACIGVACGLAVHGIVTAFGAGTLIQQQPWLYEMLRWIGVAYLIYLAWEGWQPERDGAPSPADLVSSWAPLFVRGFLSNVFNPKSILFFVSVLPALIATQGGDRAVPFQLAAYGALYVAIATIIHSAIVVFAAQLGPILEGTGRQRVRRVLSIGLALVAMWLAWSTAR